MVKARRKPFEEIKEMVKIYRNVLNVGCGGCVSVCLVGGQKEVGILNDQLTASFRQDNIRFRIDGYMVERQCNMEFLSDLDNMVPNYDCIISMACGAGVQYLAERFPEKPVLPGVNTVFIGVDKDIGLYEEKCRSCGDCVLGLTGGICPVTRCAKGLFNGPCGGSLDGKCEISKDITCAWNNIYERLKKQDRLDNILKIHPSVEWKNQIQRTFIQDEYENRYVK